MFILYAIPIGLLVGLVLGGRSAGLSALRFRWARLAVAGLLVQVVLFSPPVADRIGDLGPALYVGSTGAVLVALLRNLAVPGIPVVALGAASNFAAILANGGYMPTTAAAVAIAGAYPATAYSNSRIVEAPMLGPLTDVYALPAWVPFANVFSIGDVLIGAGVAIVIVAAMRRDATPGRGVPVGSGWLHDRDGVT